jgi:hypothetical protein
MRKKDQMARRADTGEPTYVTRFQILDDKNITVSPNKDHKEVRSETGAMMLIRFKGGPIRSIEIIRAILGNQPIGWTAFFYGKISPMKTIEVYSSSLFWS